MRVSMTKTTRWSAITMNDSHGMVTLGLYEDNRPVECIEMTQADAAEIGRKLIDAALRQPADIYTCICWECLEPVMADEPLVIVDEMRVHSSCARMSSDGLRLLS